MRSIACIALLALSPAVEDVPLARLELHTQRACSLAWSPDGSLLASGSEDGLVCVVEAAGWRRRFAVSLGKPIEVVCWSPDGATLAVGGGTREVAFLDPKDGSAWCTTGIGETVTALAFAPDGSELAVGSFHGVTWIDPKSTAHRKLDLGSANITALAYAPDGKSLFAGGWIEFRIVDPVALSVTKQFKGGHAEVYSTAVTRDGGRYAFASADESVCLRDVATGADVKILADKVRGFAWVRFSPDGATLWCGSWDKTLRAFDVASGKKLVETAAHDDRVESVAVSPDGGRVAVGLRNGIVVVRDAAKTLESGSPR